MAAQAGRQVRDVAVSARGQVVHLNRYGDHTLCGRSIKDVSNCSTESDRAWMNGKQCRVCARAAEADDEREMNADYNRCEGL